MYEILSVFSVLYPHLSTTTVRQFSRVVLGLLAMTGRVSMLNMSRWTSEGGSYRTVQRFFNTLIPWGTVYWVFFSTYLLDRESTYILAGDETTVSKSGSSTYGLSRFFSSGHGKTIPSLAFLSLSLVSVKERRGYPMIMEQIVRGDTCSPGPPETSHPRDTIQTPVPQRKRGRPKGSRNRNKTQVELSDTLKQIQTLIKALLKRIDALIPVRYLVLDGYFGHNNALQMTKQCGWSLSQSCASIPPFIFHPRCLTPDVDARVSTGSVSIHNTLIRNGASLVRRTQTLQLKCIKRNYITKSSRIP